MQQENQIEKIEGFLRKDARNQICIYSVESNKKLTPKKLNLIDLQNSTSTLLALLQQIKQNNPDLTQARIDIYKPNGNSTTIKVANGSTIVNWGEPKNVPLGEGSSVQSAVTANVAAPPGQLTPPNMENQTSMGLSAAMIQQVELISKAKDADKLAEQIRELKQDHLEEKSELKTKLKKIEQKNDDLHAELREAKSDLKTAEKFKELELLKVGLDKKPFLDPETTNKAIEILGPLLGNLMSAQNPAANASSGLNGVENLSDVKQSLIQEIAKQDFSDQMADSLMSIYILLINGDAAIQQQLASVIQQYNNQ